MSSKRELSQLYNLKGEDDNNYYWGWGLVTLPKGLERRLEELEIGGQIRDH